MRPFFIGCWRSRSIDGQDDATGHDAHADGLGGREPGFLKPQPAQPDPRRFAREILGAQPHGNSALRYADCLGQPRSWLIIRVSHSINSVVVGCLVSGLPVFPHWRAASFTALKTPFLGCAPHRLLERLLTTFSTCVFLTKLSITRISACCSSSGNASACCHSELSV